VTDVATRLRQAREQAGLDIQDISATTKIRPAFLKAIDCGAFEQLPGHFFTRHFLKAYAREVGLSPDEVVSEYDASCRPVEVAPAPPLPKSPVRGSAFGLPREPERHLTRSLWPAVALGTLMLFIGYRTRPAPDTPVEPGAVGTTGVAAAGVVATPAAQPEPAPETLSIDITPTEQIWVAATADGERAVYRMLEAGEHVKVEARREMSFRIGNAAAFEYSINGRPGRPLGGAGDVREFQITGENYRTYGR
jgi:hypothetical protein